MALFVSSGSEAVMRRDADPIAKVSAYNNTPVEYIKTDSLLAPDPRYGSFTLSVSDIVPPISNLIVPLVTTQGYTKAHRLQIQQTYH